MIHPLISIIIPIYKVEPYLRRCLDSIVNQTYTNLEIILVDDGSPDACPQICDEYAAKDKRIVVIHKQNGGLSDARNAGLDICKGEYISFVDSDDWVDEKYIEELIKITIKENADIAIVENIRTTQIIPKQSPEHLIKTYANHEALIHLFTQEHLAFTVSWGKLYKRDLFTALRFPIGKYHEDEFTTYLLFYNSSKIAYTSEPLYYYYQRTDSIVSTRHPWDVLEYLEQRYIFFKEKNESEFLPYLLPPLCWQLLCAYWHQKSHKDESSHQYINKLRYYIKDFKLVKTSFLQKFTLTIFSNIPQLYLLYRLISPIHIRKNF